MKKNNIIYLFAIMFILSACLKTNTDTINQNIEYSETNKVITEETNIHEERGTIQDSKKIKETQYENSGKEIKKEVFYAFPLLKESFILPNSDRLLLMEEELTGFTKEKLRYARNEIYARHGYAFKDALLNSFFEEHTWYKPEEKENFDELLNDIEKQNVQTIKELEEKSTVSTQKRSKFDINIIDISEKDSKIIEDTESDHLMIRYSGKELMSEYYCSRSYTVFSFQSEDEECLMISGYGESDWPYTTIYCLKEEGIENVQEIPGKIIEYFNSYICVESSQYIIGVMTGITWYSVQPSKLETGRRVYIYDSYHELLNDLKMRINQHSETDYRTVKAGTLLRIYSISFENNDNAVICFKEKDTNNRYYLDVYEDFGWKTEEMNIDMDDYFDKSEFLWAG